jgi:hypothetical protein
VAPLRTALVGTIIAAAAVFGLPAPVAHGATAQALAVPPGVIVFSHEDSLLSDYQQQYHNLYRMDAQNPATRTKLTSFTVPQTAAEMPAWSRDYSQVAFSTGFNNGLPSLEPESVFAMNPDGSNLRPITGFGLIHALPAGTGVVNGVVQAPGQIGACRITVQGSTNTTFCDGGGPFTLTGVSLTSAWVRVDANVFYGPPISSSPPGGSMGRAAIQFDASGTANLSPIVLEPQFSSSIYPSWSPDGTQLITTGLYTGQHVECTTICIWLPNDPGFQLNVWGANGKTVRTITNPPPNQYGGADWSPVQADNRICFAARGPIAGQSYLDVADPFGANVSPIYTVPSPLFPPYLNSKVTGCRWSPDGQRIAFVQLNTGIGGSWSDLYVINADGSLKKKLTQNTPSTFSDLPAWSPDGNALAYQTAVNPGFPNPVTQTSVDLYAIDPGTLAVTQLTSDHRSSNPAWAPVAAPPNPPTNVVALAGDGSATVYWTPPAFAGPGSIASFTVTSSPGGIAASVDGTATSAMVTGLANATSYTFTVTATSFAGGTSVPSAPSNAVVPGRGAYHSLPPVRIMDTRDGTGGVRVASLGPGGSLDVQITGQGGVPNSGVAAVVLNVTVTNTSQASYLTVWPTGVPRPLASNLNWTAGRTVPNLVEVAVGVGGKVSIFNAAGSTDVLFDVAGYVATPVEPPGADGLYTPVVPQRVLDTRDGTGSVPVGAIGQGGMVSVQMNGKAGLPATGVAAVVLNVTVTGPTQPSYVTVFPTGTTQPNASNLNFVAGQTVPNRVIVKVGNLNGTPGWVSFFNAAGSTQIIADIGGWFSDGTNAAATGSRFVGVTPARILDTRDGTGGFHAPLGQGTTIAATVAGVGGVPAMDATVAPSAVVLNVTVTDTTASSYLTVWPDGATQPNASDLNWVTGLTVPNLVVVKVGANGKIDLFNPAASANVIIDVVGWYG